MALMKTDRRGGASAAVANVANGAASWDDTGPLADVVHRAVSERAKPSHAQDRKRIRTYSRQQKSAERIASATVQLSSGVAEAAASAEELRKTMEQIASGAEEAASAAEESQRAVGSISLEIMRAREGADASFRKTDALQTLIVGINGQIRSTVASVGRSAVKQEASVSMVAELDRQAANIGDIVKAVARIADQTNLLALNAAIEAARAGQHGKGFAVVADEVRTLAETSEKSARDIQELVGQIQQEVKVIADGIKGSAAGARAGADRGQDVTRQLERLRLDMEKIKEGAHYVLMEAIEADGAAKEAQKGSEAIAAAAAEQSAACEEAVKTVTQQSAALDQIEQATRDLSDQAEDLRNSTDIGKSAENVAAASEQLSSAVEEINRSAAQIMTATNQINLGAMQQSAAAEESSAALTSIRQRAQRSTDSARVAIELGTAMNNDLNASRASVEQMLLGIRASVTSNEQSRHQMGQLEQVSRMIDKIIDAITTVSIQTNMLAVNGSIEAARAGEFGKGFAVVSTDIRNLAHESAENAERIKDLVKAVQDQIVAVRRDLDETATLVVAEVEKNESVNTGLASITDEMMEVLAGNNTILKNANEILNALSEATTGVDQVAAAATEAMQATQQASAATREQAKGAEALAAAVEEIASLADELQIQDGN